MLLSNCTWHLCVDRAARCTELFNFRFLVRSWGQPPSQKNSRCRGQYPRLWSRMKSIPRIKSSCRPSITKTRYSLVWPRISNRNVTFFLDEISLPLADEKVALWIFSVFNISMGCNRRKLGPLIQVMALPVSYNIISLCLWNLPFTEGRFVGSPKAAIPRLSIIPLTVNASILGYGVVRNPVPSTSLKD